MSGTERGKIEGRSVLYLAPGFMSYRVHKHVRGVQVFDLQLIRQMVELGLVVTLPAERSWKPRLIGVGRGGDGVGALGDLTKARAENGAREGRGGGAGVLKILWTPTLRKPLWNGLWAAGAMGLSRARFDVCYLGNAGEGLAQAAGLMHRLGIFQRLVLLAHRYPKRRLIALVRRARGKSLAVSNNVRSMFPDDLDPACEIRFGEMDHAKFFPPSRESAANANKGGVGGVRGDGLVHFVMLGALDTPLKDVPTALKAFGLIPDEVRAQCRLHLASFAKPPTAAELPAGVTAYPWMPIERVPEFLRSMDAMLVTSLSETFCLALVQGMLTGMPSVVRDIGTLTEKVDGGSHGVGGRGGLVFSTPEQLAEHMTTLATDAQLRVAMGEAARRTALERYTWRTEEFVREVLFG